MVLPVNDQGSDDIRQNLTETADKLKNIQNTNNFLIEEFQRDLDLMLAGEQEQYHSSTSNSNELIPSLQGTSSKSDCSFSGELFDLAEKRLSHLVQKNEKLQCDNYLLMEEVERMKQNNKQPSVENDPPQKIGTSITQPIPQSIQLQLSSLQQENLQLRKSVETIRNQKFTEALDLVQASEPTPETTEEEKNVLFKKMNGLLGKLNQRRIEQDQQLERHWESLCKCEASLSDKDAILDIMTKEQLALKERLQKAQHIIAALDNKIDDHIKTQQSSLKKVQTQSTYIDELLGTLENMKRSCNQMVQQEQILNDHIKTQDEEISRLSRHGESLMKERLQLQEQIKQHTAKYHSLQLSKDQLSKESSQEMSGVIYLVYFIIFSSFTKRIKT